MNTKPKSSTKKDTKALTEILESINDKLEKQKKDSEKPYVMKVWCYYAMPSAGCDVLIKIKGTEVIGIKCKKYERHKCAYNSGPCSCHLLEDWKTY